MKKEELQFEVGKYYYTQNGLFVKLVEVLKLAGTGTRYVVVEEEDNGDSPQVDTPYIVEVLYEDVAVTPTYLRKTQLQEEANSLAEKRNALVIEVKQLEERKKDYFYNVPPQFMVGQNVWCVDGYYGNRVVETKVGHIKVYISEKGQEIYYMDSCMDDITPYATQEEAQAALDKRTAENEARSKEYAKKRYEEAKSLVAEYEKSNS